MKRYLFYISQNYSYAMLRPLQQLIRQRGDDAVWFLEGDEVNSSYLRDDEIRLASIDAIRQYQPDAVLVPGNMVPSFIPGLKVALFHGFDVSKHDNDHYTIRDCFDLYCTQGPATTIPFKELEQKHGFFSVVETGWAAIDPLFTPLARTTENKRPTILLCSTFSRRYSCASHLYDTIRELRKNPQWQWLVQFHPKMDPAIVEQYKNLENENLTFIETDTITPLLQQADLMLCDTSSVMPMFLLLNKPVVAFNNINPGPHLINIEQPKDLENAILQGLSRPQTLMAKIREFNLQLHPYSDGLSSQRVLDAIDYTLERKNYIKNKKPLNLIRNLKARRKLNYWKL